MLNLAVRNTAKLVRAKSKSDNVRLGRLFTKKETARLMANMLTLDGEKTAYTVLDPGAGTGILSAAVVEELCKRAPKCRQIFLTCYEVNEEFIPMLEDNLERIRKKCRHDYDVRLYVTVYNENYVTESQNHYTVTLFDTLEDKFDIIICNPPTELVTKSSSEAERAGGVTQVKINAAFLFAKMAKRHLEDRGQLVIVLPTTVASASALSEYRKEMARELSLEKIHLFIGKQKNAERAVPLKKSIILGYTKGVRPLTVTVTVSTDWGKPENTTMLAPLDYDFVVDKNDGTLTLPKSTEDTKIVSYISAFPETITSLGLRVSTGLVIDSRCEELLFTEPIRGCVPLIRPVAIKGGTVRFPLPIKHQYIAPVNPTLIQKNKNLVLIKRVPAKSDKRFINAGVYMAGQLPQYKYISTHNKVNFIDTKDPSGEMCARLAFGIFALLNSTIYDRYISIVSKSKQINAKELRSLPLPPRNIIENIGMRLMALRSTDVQSCDRIVNPTLHIKSK
ncbi:MAG: methyltransferase [Clostridia bacterium]|nr:methyltransferase [Clostridia bacterium]